MLAGQDSRRPDFRLYLSMLYCLFCLLPHCIVNSCLSSFVAIENNSRFADGFAIPNLNVGRASKGFLELVLFYV